MQIMAVAKLARAALDSEAKDAVVSAGFALDAIMRIAADTSAKLDDAQIATHEPKP